MSGLHKTDAERDIKVPLISAGEYSTTMDYQRSYSTVPRDCVIPPTKHAEHSIVTGSSSKPCVSAGQTHPKQAIARMLSVTDLLERMEHQTKVCADLFPLIDKEKYMKKAPVNIYRRTFSESSGSIQDLAEISSGNNDTSVEEIQIVEQSVDETDVLFVEREPLRHVEKEEAATETLVERSRKMSKQDCIVKTPRIPPPDFMNDRGTNVATHTWIGVSTEYIATKLSNRLQINVNTLNDCPRKKGTRLIAKVCLMPGTIQQHKVDVLNALESPLQKPSVHFRGINASDLTNMDIAVRLYAKTGFFRKCKMIHEWSVAMGDLDLSDAQTAWKSIQWTM